MLVVVTRPFRFAVQGGPLNDPVALAEHARRVELLGYDELFSSDHITQAADVSGDDKVDPLVPLVVAALATDRLRVGPLVLNNELHQPALLARMVATVDQIERRRESLGVTHYVVRDPDGFAPIVDALAGR